MAETLQTDLTEPVLFARDLPATVNYDHLRTMFKDLLVARITLSAGYLVFSPTKQGWSRLLLPGLQTAKIEFVDIAEGTILNDLVTVLSKSTYIQVTAEKAFAKKNFCPIPNIFPPEILKLSTSPNTGVRAEPLSTDDHEAGRRTLSPEARQHQHPPVSLDTGVSHTTSIDDLNSCLEIQPPLEEGLQDGHESSRSDHQQRPQILSKQPTPRLNTLQEKTRVESLLKQAEIDRDHWRRELEIAQSRIKVLEFQVQEERKKAAEEIARQKDAADRVAREQARKDALVAEIGRCRQRDARMCKWDRSVALQRFLLVLDEFEGRTHSGTPPLTFEGIPWPTLDNPMVPTADTITWEKVETFFSYAKRTMTYQQYSKLVEKVHRLFHPDKWRARRVLETVPDANLRQSVEQSVNIVAQAMTPMWRESKGRSRG